MICISKQNHYCDCGQLETIEHVIKEFFFLYPMERDFLRKVSPEFDTKKGLRAVPKFLDSLLRPLC